MERANDAIERTKRFDRDVRVGEFILADGTRLGDHPAYISMLIDFTEGRR